MEEETPAAAAVGVEQQDAVGEQGPTPELPSTVSQNVAVVEEECAMAVEMAVEWIEDAVGDKACETIWQVKTLRWKISTV